MSNPTKHVVIVGGGIAGLATAFALQERAVEQGVSMRCTVLEEASEWGGKILTRRVGDLLIEAGPDSFLSQKPWGLELCAKLGLSDQLINTNEANKKTFVYSRGRLRELPEGLVVLVPTKLGPLLRSGLISKPGLLRMGLDLLLPARRSDEDETLGAFFRRRVGREAFERLIEPLMAGIYAGDAEQMSLRATFPRFAELERAHGGLIRGMLAVRPGTGAAGGRLGPSRSMFVTLREGLGEMVRALRARVEKEGAALQTKRRVEAIRVRSGQPGIWTHDLILHEGPPLAADAVVLATPAFVSAELVRPLSPSAGELLARIPYASTATVSLAYDAAQVRHAVNGFGFVVPRVEARALLAATWSSLKWSYRAPASQTLVRCYLGGVGREETLRGDDATIVRRVREDLARMAGLRAEPAYTEVHRWERGMPQYVLGHLERLDAITTSLSAYPGLFLTGAAYRGIGIPDCIRDGSETATLVIRYLTGGRVGTAKRA